MLLANLAVTKLFGHLFCATSNDILPAKHLQLRDEILSSEMDTSGYQLSDLENIEFLWADSNLNMAKCFGKHKNLTFFPSIHYDFEDLQA